MHVPGAAKGFVLFQNGVRLTRRLILQVVRGTDARNSGTNYKNVYVFCFPCGWGVDCVCLSHGGLLDWLIHIVGSPPSQVTSPTWHRAA